MMFILLALCCILTIFVYVWWTARLVKILPPRYPGCLPVIGHAHLMIGDGRKLWNLIKNVQRHCLDNGGLTHLQLGPRYIYVICDPDDYFKVMETCLEKNFWYRNILSTWVGEGLVTASVPVWKRHQKLLYPAFGQHVINGFSGIHNKQARRLVERLAGLKGPIQLLKYISQSAMESNFLTAFGLELDEYTINQMEKFAKAFVNLMQVMTERIQKLWMHSNLVYSWSELKKRQDDALKITRALSDEIIKRKRAVMKNKPITDINRNTEERFKGFMDLILELSEGGLLTEEEIRWHVDTMILAGYETSSVSTSYVCLMLGSHPDVQEKVYQELQEVFGESDRDVTKEDLSKLMYLDAVIKEVGRLYPAAPIVTRYVEKDVQLKNFTMPAGSDCAIFLSGINRHKIWGADCEEFRPERWMEAATLPEHASAFTGFSTGRRACMGKPYAVNYMKITLVHLLRRFSMSAARAALALKLEIFLKPADGCLVTLAQRI